MPLTSILLLKTKSRYEED